MDLNTVWQNHSLENLPGEEWRPVTDERYSNYYQVSNYGRVKKLRSLRRGSYGCLYYEKEKIKKQTVMKNGYHIVYLQVNKQTKGYLVHRLVGMAFIPNPHSLPQINHKHGLKHINIPDELEWITHADNVRHSFKCLPRKKSMAALGKFGVKSHVSKPIKAIDASGNSTIYYSIMEADRELGFCRGYIQDILLGRKGNATNYIFEYVKGDELEAVMKEKEKYRKATNTLSEKSQLAA